MSDDTEDFAALHARLHGAEPEGRRAVLDELVAAHPEGRLVVRGEADARSNLRGASLQGGKFRAAHLPFTDLHGSDLRGATLSQAHLRDATLEGVEAGGADLTEADLTGARLGEANLAEALLEDARLDGASLRFANLKGAVLEGAQVTGADFRGADLAGADLSGVSARAAIFGDAKAGDTRFDGADLRDADFADADLAKARFRGADLRGAGFRGARLDGADFSEARLDGVDLTRATLSGARFGGALLDQTRFGWDQVGFVGEDRDGESEAAARAYLALERNFIGLGDSSAGTLAYLRRRRMQKRCALGEAREAFGEGRGFSAARWFLTYVGDTVVEWMCNYGESVGRVFAAMVVIYFGFALLYGVIGGVERITHPSPGVSASTVTRTPTDLAVFSLVSMSNSGAASGMLQPTNRAVAMLVATQTLLGIFLTGLLGFVAGNRIRR